ncbi:unnamed protein product [Pieris macdunnoughi]|nr:unnamed protein product [Pieris macdunnoughi]
MDVCILPCLTYGSQTWVYTIKARNTLLTQHAMERSMLRLRRIHKVSNKTIRERTNVTDILKHALKMKWRWAGHVARVARPKMGSQNHEMERPPSEQTSGQTKNKVDGRYCQSGRHKLARESKG